MTTRITDHLRQGSANAGPAAVPLSSEFRWFKRGVVVKALPSNSDTVFVGAEGVTAATGFPLAPGETLTVEAFSPTEIWVVAVTTHQSVRWLGV